MAAGGGRDASVEAPGDAAAARTTRPALVVSLHGAGVEAIGQARAYKPKNWAYIVAYYERPGAGHWWGDECVDWPPLFDFLKSHIRPTDAETRRTARRPDHNGTPTHQVLSDECAALGPGA